MPLRGSFDTAAVSVSSKTVYGGAATGVAGGMLGFDWLALIGGFVALAGLAVQVFFSIRQDRRRERESRAYIEATQRGKLSPPPHFEAADGR